MRKETRRKKNIIFALILVFVVIATISTISTYAVVRFMHNNEETEAEKEEENVEVEPEKEEKSDEDTNESEADLDEDDFEDLVEITWGVQGIESEEADGDDSDDKEADKPKEIEVKIEDPSNYDAVFFDVDYDDFCEAGFEPGDSCTIEFESGEKFEDIPFYTGYYTQINGIILCTYNAQSDLELCSYLSNEYWDDYNFSEGDKVKISVESAGKYKDIERAMKLTYPNNREDYPNDESYANFREMSGGNMMPGVFFRGSSPINPEINRIDYVNALMKKNNIQYVLDLSDTKKEYLNLKEQNISDFSYDMNLFLEDKITFFGLNFEFTNDEYSEWVVEGLKDMLRHDGPYYFHCTEGKDRTGFVCMLLEALAGASYKEMKRDYMLSYYYYFGINKETNEKTYDLISEQRFKTFLYIIGDLDSMDNLKEVDYQNAAREYLYNGGMTEDEVNRLYAILTGIVIE